MAEEGADFFFSHLVWMTFVVEENEAADPIDIGLLGSDAVAFNAQMPTDAVEQFPRGRWSRIKRRIFQNAKGRLPPVVDLAFVSRVSHYGNGSKQAATGEGNFG